MVVINGSDIFVDLCFMLNQSSPSVSAARDAHHAFSYTVAGIVTFALVLLGVSVNSVALAVFGFSRNRPCIYRYLIALSVWDILLLSGAAALFSGPMLFLGKQRHIGSYAASYKWIYAFANASFLGPLYVVMALTLDRWLALCHPFRHLRLMGTHTSVRKLLWGVSVFAAVLFGVPRFFELTAIPCVDPATMEWSFRIAEAPLRRNWYYRVYYKILVLALFHSIGPFAFLLILSIFIMMAIRRMFRRNGEGEALTQTVVVSATLSRRRSTSLPSLHHIGSLSDCTLPKMSVHSSGGRIRVRRDSRRTNIMLLALICKFLVSQTVVTLIDVIEILSPSAPTHVAFDYLVDISNLMVVLNSSTNFLIYIFGSQRFRQELLSWFLGVYRRRMSNEQVSATSIQRRKPSVMSLQPPQILVTATIPPRQIRCKTSASLVF